MLLNDSHANTEVIIRIVSEYKYGYWASFPVFPLIGCDIQYMALGTVGLTAALQHAHNATAYMLVFSSPNDYSGRNFS